MIAFSPGAPERTILHVGPYHIETQLVSAVVTFSLNHIKFLALSSRIGLYLNVEKVQRVKRGCPIEHCVSASGQFKPQKPSASCLNVWRTVTVCIYTHPVCVCYVFDGDQKGTGVSHNFWVRKTCGWRDRLHQRRCLLVGTLCTLNISQTLHRFSEPKASVSLSVSGVGSVARYRSSMYSPNCGHIQYMPEWTDLASTVFKIIFTVLMGRTRIWALQSRK